MTGTPCIPATDLNKSQSNSNMIVFQSYSVCKCLQTVSTCETISNMQVLTSTIRGWWVYLKMRWLVKLGLTSPSCLKVMSAMLLLLFLFCFPIVHQSIQRYENCLSFHAKTCFRFESDWEHIFRILNFMASSNCDAWINKSSY